MTIMIMEGQQPLNREELDFFLKGNIELEDSENKKYKPAELVGSSGAFDSVVEIIHGELGGEPLTEKKTGYEIDMEQYHAVAALIENANLEERKEIRGLTPMRYDMIVVSCLLIDFVLEEYKINKMRVSTYSLKEGALFDFISRQA